MKESKEAWKNAGRGMLVPHRRRKIETEIDIVEGITCAFGDGRNANSMAGRRVGRLGETRRGAARNAGDPKRR